jgi:phenylacetate-CoA ligase
LNHCLYTSRQGLDKQPRPAASILIIATARRQQDSKLADIFFDRAAETMPRPDIRRAQGTRLRDLLASIHDNPFYRRKLSDAGVSADAIRSIDDLERLPFTTKSELVAEQTESPPFGDLLSYPLSHYRYFHQTSGTSGRPLKWLDTAEDWQWWLDCWQYVFNGAGIGKDDSIFFPFSFGPYISHWVAIDGARQLGALCISGAAMNSKQRLQMMLDNRCTVLVCTPSYALRLAEVAAENQIALHECPVRVTIHAGEPGASLPNVSRAIESAWGARCYDHAGATEVGAWGFACGAADKALHLNEREFIFEVVDPASGERVADGTRGELVITNLGRHGMPVLRYRTGDLVEISTEACTCQRTFARAIGGVLGRADDMLIVRGVNLYPSAIDNLIRGHPAVVEYEVAIRRVRGMDSLSIKVETDGGASFAAAEAALVDAFREAFNISVVIEHAAANTLPRYEMKARRFRRID